MAEEKQSFDQKLFRFMCIAIMVVAIFWMAITLYRSFLPQQQEKIIFEVVGVTNSSNATTLVSLHFDCIKFCSDSYQIHSSQLTQECWKECQSLGKEYDEAIQLKKDNIQIAKESLDEWFTCEGINTSCHEAVK